MGTSKSIPIFQGIILLFILFVLLFDAVVYWDKVLFYIPKPVKDKGIFIVELPGCKIPMLDPMHPTIRGFIYHSPPLTCTQKNKRPLVVKGRLARRPSLRISDHATRLYGKNITCTYKGIYREHNRLSYTVLKNHFINSTLTNIKDEFIQVTCRNQTNSVLDDDYFPFIQRKADVERRCQRANSHRNKTLQRFNVLLLGIDSMSRNQFLRHMKKTHKYLNEHFTHVEMHGFNKVGSNTFPNLIALTTGKLESEFRYLYKKYLDDIPFIWKDFRKLGYKTLYAQDKAVIDPFSYAKRGFLNPPTDYYYRPFSIVLDHSSAILKKPGCLKYRLESDVILDYTLDFYDMFPNDLLFSLTFLSRLSHDRLNSLSHHDEPFLRFFKRLRTSGHLNRTFVVFFGDHGFRQGKFRASYIGRLEEKLPFMTIILPPWFKTKHPGMYSNLKTNRRRLTTLFDINAMLKGILTFVDGHPTTNLNSNGRGVNLLAGVVSTNRTCRSASIALEFCSCLQLQPVKTTSVIVTKAAHHLVETINQITQRVRKVCAKVALDQVLQSAASFLSMRETSTSGSLSTNYRLTIKVQPSGGIFEGFIWYASDEKQKFTVFPEIDRINLYGNQSACVNEAKLKPFCYCVSQ